jgi:hypothetical protein
MNIYLCIFYVHNKVLATSSSPNVRAREWMRARWERWESEEKIG